MATREEAKSVIERLYGKPSDETFKKFNNDNAGIYCMLKYLANIDRPVSAGEISGFMKVSTARVSVLLKKMNEKGFIIREKSSEDARKLMISLSEKGREEDKRHVNGMIETFRKIIDQVGSDRMEEFIAVSQQIRSIMHDEIKDFDAD